MPTAQPDAAIVSKLAAAGLGLTSGTNLFAGPVRPVATGVPANAVFVMSSGGRNNDRLLGTSSDYRVYSVQVRIRADKGDFDGGQTLARSCRDALHCATVTGYVFCQVREPHPIYISYDTEEQHHWSLNVELVIVT